MPDLYKTAMSLNPTGRMGTPQEVAAGVVFLASPVAKPHFRQPTSSSMGTDKGRPSERSTGVPLATRLGVRGTGARSSRIRLPALSGDLPRDPRVDARRRYLRWADQEIGVAGKRVRSDSGRSGVRPKPPPNQRVCFVLTGARHVRTRCSCRRRAKPRNSRLVSVSSLPR